MNKLINQILWNWFLLLNKYWKNFCFKNINFYLKNSHFCLKNSNFRFSISNMIYHFRHFFFSKESHFIFIEILVKNLKFLFKENWQMALILTLKGPWKALNSVGPWKHKPCCLKNDYFCLKNDYFCLKNDNFYLKNYYFCQYFLMVDHMYLNFTSQLVYITRSELPSDMFTDTVL